MKTTLLITTYNWPEALDITLRSIENQSIKPTEIIIADDGSTKETKNLIEKWKVKLKIPIIHSWQEDIGFRAAASRNKAIVKSSGDYIIMIDGDLILHPEFIENHIKHCKSNHFNIGPRVLIKEDYSKKLLEKKSIDFSIQSNHILANRKNIINSNVLSKIFSHLTKSHRQVRSCNMACFKKDLIKVNGFNEDFIGWGREDTELVVRLLNANVKRKNIKFNANTLHIYHKENNKKMLTTNDLILERTLSQKLASCQNGLDKYL
ncbi:glycosyltransferase family 2 protein [Flavobacterium muglaense]|uniref:Glycosyltransferase family 2 protein n=1 Tax=Flavobacterium muglaense TaxID=2764716 RepID=A0A923MX34_9FLAO|nr:glycosyltransferase family 2 protein [Flavobacterium muglaense]MBC5836627.1 glycosyltransferase family 2 protein [Flavobacterium muglaense]MBC5843107.1 glycosyltransferase family 2 protein [Flavobacterium muglaense]